MNPKQHSPYYLLNNEVNQDQIRAFLDTYRGAKIYDLGQIKIFSALPIETDILNKLKKKPLYVKRLLDDHVYQPKLQLEVIYNQNHTATIRNGGFYQRGIKTATPPRANALLYNYERKQDLRILKWDYYNPNLIPNNPGARLLFKFDISRYDDEILNQIEEKLGEYKEVLNQNLKQILLEERSDQSLLPLDNIAQILNKVYQTVIKEKTKGKEINLER